MELVLPQAGKMTHALKKLHIGERCFRTGAEGMRHARRSTTPLIFFPEKENGRCDRPKERLRLAVSGLNDLYASGMKMIARGVAALALLDDLAYFYYPLPLCPARRSAD